ncbi:MAG: hypothetical protein LBF97_02530, partial [Elusimicrobiota bacterium]|nr:hypothetical protein [Elusimicrobiota bacterium]
MNNISSNRIFNFILTFVFIISIFSLGCAKKERSDRILVWHWMTDRDDAFIELANKYKEIYGVEV